MKTFAYLIHPINVKQLRNFSFFIRFIPRFILKLFFKRTWPFIVYKVKNLPSGGRAKSAQGFFIVLPEIIGHTYKESLEAMERIISAGSIAQKSGAAILGLGGYAALFCDKGYTAIRGLKIPVTSGSTYAAWSAFEAIYRMAKIKQLDLSRSHVAIINAASAIGSLCSRKLSGYAAKITLNSHPELEFKLKHLQEVIPQLNPETGVAVHISTARAVRDADIVIFSDDIPEAELDITSLRPNTILCDASVSGSLTAKAKSRQDITVVRAGLIKIPKPVRLNINTGLPAGIIPASLAETMLLLWEGKLSNYSLGESINLDKMEEIADIATRHGFEVWVPEAPIL
ncbi:MAG: hypothetical protein MUC39_03525 [Candidatus Omnitrophica bacterium]|jgi:predicted amino acid dehydrogenase|nr:hypothetical protein [Candidatus Omnitrophota bacterium]